MRCAYSMDSTKRLRRQYEVLSNFAPTRKVQSALHLLSRKALGGCCRGYVPGVLDQDDSAESHRDQHESTLQQDGSRITPKYIVILE
jgi:hypothetical protein